MTPEEFVQCFRRTKDELLSVYFDASSGSATATQLAALARSQEEVAALQQIVSTVLTDAFYTALLGLDGCASLGGVQQSYRIQDEHGAELCTGDGTIEALAHDYFHGNRNA
ncbi:MAG TPA: hypothetical protein VF614_16210 [Chthoniobacteraceae bacterium]|jgi:hypothetical protein